MSARVPNAFPAFMQQALQHVVRDRDMSKEELDQISANLEFYFKPLGKTVRHTLARKIGEDPSRVERIGNLSPSSLLLDILAPLIRSGVRDADRQCKNTVENLPVDSWKSYLEGSGDWVFSLLENCPRDFKLTLGSNAVVAAVALIDARSAALSASERARVRRLINHFNVHAERRIIDAIASQSQSNARNALALIKAVNDETVASISSHLSSEKLLNLLSALSLISEGRGWLEAQTDALHNALNRFDRPSKNLVRDWFKKTKAEKPRARANWIEMMGHRLGFDR